MINEPIQHDKQYPPAASAGGNNAYYLKGCDAVQRSPSYAACLFKIGEIDAGRENVLFNDCAEAHRGGKCLARGMREQEQLAGAAMFFFPRENGQARFVPFKLAGDFGVPITNLTDPALIPKEKKVEANRFANKPLPTVKPDPLDVELDAQEGGYAAAITAAIAELPVEPAPAPAPPKSAPKPPAPPAPAPAPVAAAARPPIEPGETPLQYARRLAATRNSNQENK